jgi:predicted HD phosphohydrolase
VTSPPTDFPELERVVALLRAAGAREEPNESVAGLTILHHSLQCAARLRDERPDDPGLQVAGLLHDLGHLVAPGRDDAHGEVGAALARPVFGDRVADLVAAHVPAKRYLVTVDTAYRGRLSEGSLRTLAHQGGTMSAGEVADFRRAAVADDAVVLRRADEAAKDPAAAVPGLDTWLPILVRLAG